MFASVSHEFRTPLNAFTNSVILLETNYNMAVNKINEVVPPKIKELLKDKRVDESNEKFFRICKISSTILMSLIEDILDLAKIEAGTFSLDEKPFLIKTLVEEIDYIFSFQWAQKKIFFKIEISEDLKNSFFCSDLNRIKQILMNLVSNSFKFTQMGGIIIKIKRKVITDELEFKRVPFLIFKVIDTGVGIAKADIPHLFKMFGMINKHKNRLNNKGTGLGLTISKKLTESLGGKISIESHEGIGTEISFRIKENIIKENHLEESKHEVSDIFEQISNRFHESWLNNSDITFNYMNRNLIKSIKINDWDLKLKRKSIEE